MNEVSTETVALDTSSSRFSTNESDVFGTVTFISLGTEISVVPNREGVRDRDVEREEHRDDGLEFRDCRKSSNGISSDLKNRTNVKN